MPSTLQTADAFKSATESPELSVVHFSADWAEQCGQVNDVLDALGAQKDLSAVKFYKCQAESLSEISLKNKIEAVPTVVLFKGGKVIDRVNGADAAAITEKIKSHAKTNTANGAESLEDRLKALINRANVMLFMKGSPEQPRCGFSKQIIAILGETGVKFDYFDIFSDEEVRQGLKTYSDWPTYPQLYVKGELIGGLDIVKEMKASGSLNEALTS